MPENQSQLWDLLSLLAQLQESALASLLVQELSDPDQHPPILLGDIVHHSTIVSLTWQKVWDLRSIVGGLKSSIVGGLRGGGCGLGLGLLVGLLLLVIVLVHPRRLAVTEVLVREHVGSLREHVGGGGGGGGNGRVVRGLVLWCLGVWIVVFEVVSGRCGWMRLQPRSGILPPESLKGERPSLGGEGCTAGRRRKRLDTDGGLLARAWEGGASSIRHKGFTHWKKPMVRAQRLWMGFWGGGRERAG